MKLAAERDKAAFAGLDIFDGASADAKSYTSDTMCEAVPDLLIRARDEHDLKAALRQCFAASIPTTLCAGQSSMTGASVTAEGALIACEKLEGVRDISLYHGKPVAVVRSGTITADVQRAVSEAGYFFPVSPTSREMSRIAGNVATNASGEDSYKYGSMRHYVRQLKVLLADGTEKVFSRTQMCSVPRRKNLAGLELAGCEPIDWLIGSEGTLGAITEVMLDLLPQEPQYFAVLVPFPSLEKALQCVLHVTKRRHAGTRALEFIDSLALQYLKTHPKVPQFSLGTQALLYIKQEYANEQAQESELNAWLELVQPFTTPALLDETIVAFSESEKTFLRDLRHQIPSQLNEGARKYWPNGGGKVGSDWWVPVEQLPSLLDFFFEEAASAKLPAMAYAHVGDGHPHTNLLALSAAEKSVAKKIIHECCRRAVRLGGGAAGEHGIGKINHELVVLQHDKAGLAHMREIKQMFDPKNLLGRGNIFT